MQAKLCQGRRGPLPLPPLLPNGKVASSTTTAVGRALKRRAAAETAIRKFFPPFSLSIFSRIAVVSQLFPFPFPVPLHILCASRPFGFLAQRDADAPSKIAFFKRKDHSNVSALLFRNIASYSLA